MQTANTLPHGISDELSHPCSDQKLHCGHVPRLWWHLLAQMLFSLMAQGNAIVDADDGISLALVPVHSTDQTIKPKTKTKTEFVHTILYNRSVA